MKNASDDSKVLVAQVETSKARFSHDEDLGIEFKNEIDAWTKMEITFRKQIKHLKDKKDFQATTLNFPKKNRQDLKSLVYSVRQRLE